MSLSVIQNLPAIRPGNSCPFAGVGGTEPYVYSVLPGGAGGSINPATGLYRAPAVVTTVNGVTKSTDTIRVTDNTDATATATIAVLSPLELVCDIVQREMELGQGQVYLWDQKIAPVTDSRLYIAISVLSCKPFANDRIIDGSVAGLTGLQSVNMRATLSIDVFSRGPEARDRKEEVLLALNSWYAEQQQNANAFRIFPITENFVNISEIDGAAIPYRFNVSVNMQYFVTKTKQIEYFDTFEDSTVITNQ